MEKKGYAFLISYSKKNKPANAQRYYLIKNGILFGWCRLTKETMVPLRVGVRRDGQKDMTLNKIF